MLCNLLSIPRRAPSHREDTGFCHLGEMAFLTTFSVFQLDASVDERKPPQTNRLRDHCKL